MAERAAAVRAFHNFCAVSAATIARSVSARPICGTSATTSPVAGFVTLKDLPESAPTH